MNIVNTVTRLCVGISVVLLLSSSFAYAANRNGVFAELNKLNTRWADISINFWINDFENDPDPGVKVGDRLNYRAKSNMPAYFVLILVDAKGSTSILKPDALAVNGITDASRTLTFPNVDESNTGQNFIEQAEPLGKETVYLLASEQPLPTSVFDIDTFADYADYGTDISEVTNLITRLNSYSDLIKMAVVNYEYYVDSDTQFSSRGIRREISKRVQEVEGSVGTPMTVPAESIVTTVDASATLNSSASSRPEPQPEPQPEVVISMTPIKSSPIVINDINFEFDSDVLTSTGVSQLEILGSELVDRQGRNQLPKVLLTGYTDSVGSAEYNMALSKRRSVAARRFLVEELGLPAEYIDTQGLGESSPIESNDTKRGRERNRRVEFEVIQ